MTAVTNHPGNIAVVVVPGDLVAETIDELQQQIATQTGDANKVVLDLQNCQFIDSAGCGALLAGLKRLRESGGNMVVCNITRPVRALFDLVRMPLVLTVYPTTEDAIGALAN